jgi:nucleoside-diphosphate-sugar epimerase
MIQAKVAVIGLIMTDITQRTMDAKVNSIGPEDLILITGAAGYIGSKVVESLLNRGYRNLRCMVRPSSNMQRLETILSKHREEKELSVYRGNLLSKEDCSSAARNVKVIYHLAAGTGTKSFPDAFMNSVITTRNLLDAVVEQKCLMRFVNVSSFAVYTNQHKPKKRLLDESCPVEQQPALRYDPYCFAKVKQDEMVTNYGKQYGIPYVVVRPGVVYGPGRYGIPGRIGLASFGIFLHFGGSNTIPLTYVDNCADAIVLAGLKMGIEGEVFNIVDDDLPTSRQVLRLYKKNVEQFKSIYVPRIAGYVFYFLWEKYSNWSQGQLPAVYNVRGWHAYWKKTSYTNAKLKQLLGWQPTVSITEGLQRYLKGCQQRGADA